MGLIIRAKTATLVALFCASLGLFSSIANAEPSVDFQTASYSTHNLYYPSRESLRSRSRLESLILQLHSSSDVFRTHAATDMSFLERPAAEVVPALVTALLSDSSKWVRRAAARSLGKIGSRMAVPALNAALSDRDKWVAHSAQNALLHIRAGR